MSLSASEKPETRRKGEEKLKWMQQQSGKRSTRIIDMDRKFVYHINIVSCACHAMLCHLRHATSVRHVCMCCYGQIAAVYDDIT